MIKSPSPTPERANLLWYLLPPDVGIKPGKTVKVPSVLTDATATAPIKIITVEPMTIGRIGSN